MPHPQLITCPGVRGLASRDPASGTGRPLGSVLVMPGSSLRERGSGFTVNVSNKNSGLSSRLGDLEYHHDVEFGPHVPEVQPHDIPIIPSPLHDLNLIVVSIAAPITQV